MKISADGFEFNFKDALDVFIFDEKDSTKNTFHGLPMKAVDIIAELQEAYIFVEMKYFHDVTAYNEKNAETDGDIKKAHDSFKWLKNYLKYKYRDSYLFRYAENKVDKPIHYICLLNLDHALNTKLQKDLTRELPVGTASKRWQLKIADSCHVMSLEKWNTNFPKWSVVKL